MTDCVLWPGSVINGYGVLWVGGRASGHRVMAHRLVYEAARGPVPDGLVLDHLCRNTRCINPAHLEPVTDRVNILRGVGPSAVNANKTHCAHGHPLDEINTYIDGTRRRCRLCNRRRSREYLGRKRSAAA